MDTHFSLDETLEAKPIYFNEGGMKPSSSRYICWLDVMGSGNAMGRSMARAANFIMKLHVAALEARGFATTVELYPMIDGLYICTENLQEMFSFIKRVFVSLAVTFISEPNPLFRFIVRGGLSNGPVVRQLEVQGGSYALSGSPERTDYCKRILIGLPLAQAYDEERHAAPPYGIAMHESVRAFGHVGSGPVSGRYFKWWDWNKSNSDADLASLLEQELGRYYKWCLRHSYALGYDEDRIVFHQKLVKDYFSDETAWQRD